MRSSESLAARSAAARSAAARSALRSTARPHSRARSLSSPPALLSLLLLLLAGPAAATSFVAVADRDLADQAALIVTGHVVSGAPGVERGGVPVTVYQVEPDRVIKGVASGPTITVRSPGGVRADGLGLWIAGAPRFAAGERVLLFLQPDAADGYRVLHLMLGAFHERQSGAGPVWQREIGDAEEVTLPGRRPADAERGPRHRQAFVDWLTDRAAGIEREPDYSVAVGEAPAPAGAGPAPPDGAPVPLPAGFTLFEVDGFNLRWHHFDTGGVVRWRVHQDGQPGLPMAQTLSAFRTAMGAWSSGVPNIIDYQFGQPQLTTATGGLSSFDGVDAIVFGDPNDNPDFGGPFSCTGGGILALGGPWFTSQLHFWQGKEYLTIIGADVVTNQGLECFFTGTAHPEALAAQLFAHELGHTLGIGHSCGDSNSPPCAGNPVLNDAAMRAFIHSADRGARLNVDDRGACNALYAGACAPYLEDGFESGDLSAWSSSAP